MRGKLLVTIFSLSLTSLGQVSEYENQLALYISEFKRNAFYDEIRMDLFEKISAMNDLVKIKISMTDYANPDYRNLVSIQKKISAFNNFQRCFSKFAVNACQIEEFIYIMNLLQIVPKELPDLSCDLATIYEISINGFKATMVYNLYDYQDIPGRNIIRVEYDAIHNGKAISGGYLNVGPNQIRCIKYQSDKQTFYPKIVTVRCIDLKND